MLTYGAVHQGPRSYLAVKRYNTAGDLVSAEDVIALSLKALKRFNWICLWKRLDIHWSSGADPSGFCACVRLAQGWPNKTNYEEEREK